MTLFGYFIVKRQPTGWADNKVDGQLEVVAGPFWNFGEAVYALSLKGPEFEVKKLALTAQVVN